MKKTEKELLLNQRMALHKIDAFVKSNQLDQVGNFFPGFLHFNRKNDLHIQYMNPKGLQRFDVSLDYIQNNGADFFERYVHKTTMTEVFPRFINFYNQNDYGRTYAECQELANPLTKDYYQILTVTKVVKELDGMMSMSLPVSELGTDIRKIKKLIKIDAFYETHFEKFQSLTFRERELLKMIALGYSNKEIAIQLAISIQTVQTHRKHIWRKLEIKNLVAAIRYAEVFELI